ncbi:MAG: hypothetical protein AB7R40_23180 [Nitrospiraceae bacterium]
MKRSRFLLALLTAPVAAVIATAPEKTSVAAMNVYEDWWGRLPEFDPPKTIVVVKTQNDTGRKSELAYHLCRVIRESLTENQWLYFTATLYTEGYTKGWLKRNFVVEYRTI